ncbi:DNA polymerase III subunit chi [Roseivivax sediminis]|uniref:DNA polymerase III, chi subunit n=1 Tax=Roseivivax sediminis TaxID=936889 RepID=A0A1I1WUI9_9RHOB|nr:DNA polymerase III subunit chi [Roseivivax sediminis]SFD98807.1 DNA polymerase III, chi subunit [Roseivivax sediminis]
MGAAYFYHLTRRPLEVTLPVLLDKALGAGWRVAVRGTRRDRLEWLDEKLWLGPEDGFLPHGLAGGPHDAAQPVLLTDRAEAPNGARCVMAIDGAEVAADEVRVLERVCILFDGADAAAVQEARGQWKALTGAGCAAQYWSEESGRWEKKAEA